MDYKVEIRGLDELRRKWEQAPPKVKERANQALLKSGYAVEREAKLLVSNRMVNVRTGRLRSSISLSSSLAMRSQPHVVISPHVFYAIFLHEGTKYIKPRPFMTRGYEQARSQIKKEMKDLMRFVIKEMK